MCDDLHVDLHENKTGITNDGIDVSQIPYIFL